MTLRQERRLVRGGFTLMEMLVVVAIIVVLAGAGTMIMLPRLEEAKERTALGTVKGTLTTACETYKLNNGDYPPSLEALAQMQPNGGAPMVDIDAIKDPWGQPYGYDPTGAHSNGLKPDIWFHRPEK